MAHLAPPGPPLPPAAGLANFPQFLSFPRYRSRGTPYASGTRHGIARAGNRQAIAITAGGLSAMKKRIRRFVLHHENLCAFILSIFGAFLTIVLTG